VLDLMNKGDKSRREFLKSCASGVAAFHLASKAWPEQARASAMALAAEARSVVSTKSKVVIARDAALRGTGTTVDSNRILNLLDRAMQSLYELDHPAEAWKKVVHPGERVGIKVNALGGRGLSSNVQLVEAICERLQQAGIRASDIVIWDRDTEELEHVGFRFANADNRVQCFGTDRVDYEQELQTHGTIGSRLSKILTQHCDVLINVPVLKDHDGAGVTIALKNMYGVIHNPNKYHPNGCDPYIADLNMLPGIRAKMRLTICDATTACYEGGPGYKPQYCWQDNALLVSRDPVALDYTGWQIIERKRAEEKLKTLGADQRAPHYIATAADERHRLGTNDPRLIEVVEVSM
jgi:uncharacterized protein (DUF362 family)